MAEVDPTQRDLTAGIAEELAAAGFEDVHEIGRGGFGVVYRCAQRSLDRSVAIKVLTADLGPDNLQRFLREQRAMGKLSGHPHIVSVFQVGATASGRPYLVMQYHPAGSLDMRMHKVGLIDWRDAVHIGVEVAGALETAHRLGTLHRDVKPGNILLTEYGEPQLTDFGIARIAGGFETAAGFVTGSPAYTAPEVLQGETPTPAADVYGLGATLFCAITGHAAFERRSGEQVVAQFLRISKQPIPDLREAGIPGDVSAAIETAMARDTAARPATAAEFGELLRAVQHRHGMQVDEMPVPVSSSSGATGAQHSGRSPTAPRTAVATLTPPAAATRFRPPPPTRVLVPRRRLLDTLRAGQRRRLVLIHAPTGYGKSTLAAQWRDILTGEGVAVAWLTVDHDDNNVVWFLAHLIEAIRSARPVLARELGEALQVHGDEAERYVLTSLINEIHERGERVAVVIDDWHRVTDPATVAAMGFLLDNGCHHLQVVVTSRTQSGLPLSRMRVRDELVEIDSAALRFDDDESQNFLVDLGGLELERSDVEALTESTDGWVAALQLASLSLRGCDDPTLLIGHLSGRHHGIGEFLAENVLAALEPQLLDFLLATSISERTCGELASALAGVPHGQAVLEQIEERDLFLRRLGEDGRWFRYHHLFAEFLQHRLERDHPERIRQLHRTACQWFAEHRLISDAVDHALAADDEERAIELVESDGTYLLEQSQMTTLLGLVGKLPPNLVEARPRLQLAVAWANILVHRPVPANRALDLVDSLLEQGTLTESETTDLRVEADVVRSVVELRADRPVRLDELVSPALSRPDTLPPWVVSVAANVATFGAIYRFDFEAARRLQDWAHTYHLQNNGPWNTVMGQCWVGVSASEQLDLHAAEDNFRKALRMARRSGGGHSHLARLAGSLLGALLYERGEITEAERLLDEGYKLGAEGGPVDDKLARYVVGARVKALRGDRAEAARRLTEGARIAENLSLRRLRAAAENERIRLKLPVDLDLGAPPPVEYSARRPPDDGIEEIVAQLEEATTIRLLLAEHPGGIELACIWAQEWVDTLEGQRRPRALLLARRLLVECLAAAGRTDEAKAMLASITAQCARLGMIRFLPDGGPHIASLLAALRDAQQAERWQPEWAPIPASFMTELVADPQDTI